MRFLLYMYILLPILLHNNVSKSLNLNIINITNVLFVQDKILQ